MSNSDFMERAFPHAVVIPHVDPSRFTIDLRGETRPRMPIESWARNLGVVLGLAALAGALEASAFDALTQVPR